jgi:hypothetical protein
MADDERVAILGELERADEAVGVELAELDELYGAVEDVRGRAVELQELELRLPAERAVAAEAVVSAEHAVADADRTLARASAELEGAETAGDPERLAEARRFEIRARDHLHIAERKAASAQELAAELDARAEAAGREAAGLEARARELAEALERTPRLTDEAVASPGRGPDGVSEWGTRARAALLVARSQLAAERDAVLRQANELGAVLLGEALPPTSAAAVARRVEAELGER